MNKNLKIFLSAIFVLTVAFFVARGCWHGPSFHPTPKAKQVKTVLKKKAKPAAQKTVSGAPAHPQMAIILDDWGLNLALVKDAEAIERPLTLSVLPHLTHSREIADEAASHGLGIMLHMPMQPKSLRQPLEPRTILTTTPDAQILDYLDKALESVPHVDGVNNHQGSAATSDERVMKTVLDRKSVV